MHTLSTLQMHPIDVAKLFLFSSETIRFIVRVSTTCIRTRPYTMLAVLVEYWYWEVHVCMLTQYMHTHVQIIQKRETAIKPPAHYRSASLTYQVDSLTCTPTSTLERGKKVESGMGLELDDELFPIPRMITISGIYMVYKSLDCTLCTVPCGVDDLYLMWRPLPSPNTSILPALQ